MNRLADESSPYLRQHADNPVHWWPWCEEAFAEARDRDLPVLLSVGYAACHWCHVMAHESFEDETTAAVMNDMFVNIKVDREERPDVDAVYMEAVQALTGRGGWPMTVFLTHDAQPFFGGTYFPPKGRPGLPGFVDVCQAVSTAWNERREGITEQAGKLTASLNRVGELEPEGDALPGLAELAAASAGLAERYDRNWGGFGGAPKFPQPDLLETLLRAHRRQPDPEVMSMVSTTLDAMAAGGMYDHLGGGFARYSVDDRWLVPHFEKMLSDQALLARAYLHGWQVTGRAGYLQVLTETIEYVRRDLRDQRGGFYSSEDADSEGVEGRFYVWSVDEITAILGESAPAAVEWWGVTEAGNFEGANILFRPIGADLVRPALIEESRAALFAARERRVRPGLDDKVLTEWNGHMIAALAEAGAATANPDWIDDASSAGEFLLDSLRRADGRWLRAWHSGQAGRHLACAADYAAVVDAFTCLAEATGRRRWVDEARAAADAMLDLFWDDAAGGLFTTGNDAERLVTRAKDVTDGALPSANGNAAYALMRLGALVGDDRYRERAEAIMALLGGLVRRHPTAFSRLLAAVDMSAGPLTEVAVVGDRSDLVAAVQARYLPNAVLAWGEPYESPLFEAREPGKAYVCEGYACKAPVTEVESLLAQLAT